MAHLLRSTLRELLVLQILTCRAAFAAVAFAIITFQVSSAAQDIPRGGTLVVGSTQTPRHLNGAVQSGAATALSSTQLFASPLRFDDQWNPQPYLAESWELAQDGRSVTLNLRKDAVFHDGHPITSDDVAFSIMAIKANHPFESMMGPVEAVETPDPYTAILRMSRPHPAILLALSPPLAPILPRHIYGDGQDLKSHPRNSQNIIGSGPFRLVEHEPGRRIILERFDRFFLPGRPYLDKVVISIVSDLTTSTMQLQRGDFHLLGFVSTPAELQRLAKDPDIHITAKGYEGIGALNWLAFNLERKPMSDLLVRKAIAMAIDRDFILKALMGGYSFPADGPIPPASPFHSANDVVRYPFDLQKAGTMLDSAGYKMGANGERFKVTIDYYPGSDAQQKNVAEYLRAQLKKIGIAVVVRTSADFPSWAQRMATHDFDMSMDANFTWGDPVIGVHRTYLSSNIKPIVWTNTQSYRNPQVDDLLAAASSEMDPAKRKAYYARFQNIVSDELPVYVIDQVGYYTVTNKRVGHVPRSIWGTLSPFDEVYLK